MHDGMPYGRIQGQGQGHEPIQGSSIENLQSREVDRQSSTGLIFDNHLEQCVALNIHCMCFSVLCCFDAVDWVTGRMQSL